MSNRGDRFTQSSRNGITMYDRHQVREFVDQFEKFRTESYDDIIDLLNYDLNENHNDFKKYWKKAKTRYDEDPDYFKSSIKMSDGDNFGSACHIALICYTDGYAASSVYNVFNEDCRDVCSGSWGFGTINHESLFHLLRFVMENKEETEDFPDRVYRGCEAGFAIDNFSNGKPMGFGHFTSTSSNYDIGKGFATNQGTLFIVDDPGEYQTKFIRMADHSHFAYEEEYLLSPFQLYKIGKTKQSGNLTKVYLKLV